MKNYRYCPPKMWQDLMNLGWVNMTGIPVLARPVSCYGNPYDFIFPLPTARNYVIVGYNHGMSVAYIPGGTVWLHAGNALSGNNTIQGLFTVEFRGKVFVPCSNGEQVDGFLILQRIADPFWNGGETTDSKGEPLGYMRYPAIIEELRRHPKFIEYQQEAILMSSISKG